MRRAVVVLALGAAVALAAVTATAGDVSVVQRKETAVADLDRVLDGYQRLRATAGDRPIAAEWLDEIDRLVAEADLEYLRAEIPKSLVQMRDGVQRVATIVRALEAFAHPDRAEMETAPIPRRVSAGESLAQLA